MQFNVHEAKSNLSQLLDLVAQGQEVILARNGNPVAKLVALDPPKSLLGAGVGDPNFIGGALTDAQSCAPLDPEDLKPWEGDSIVPA
jgi:prevent-host-death family protein